jgi:hypothetical protein
MLYYPVTVIRTTPYPSHGLSGQTLGETEDHEMFLRKTKSLP